MKLLVLSDLHLEFADMAVPAGADFDVAVLAGDIVCPGSNALAWARRASTLERAKAVVLVPGNHEYYDGVMPDELAAMRRAARDDARRSISPPAHLLDGDVAVIDGVRFLGCTLWTDFELRIDTADGPVSDVARGMAAARRSMVDYRTIDVVDPAPQDGARSTRKLTPEDTLALHRTQRAWLQRALAEPFDGPTVVVTHHGPHRGSLASHFAADCVSTAFISELPPSFFDVPSLWIHGHTHASFDYRVGRCRVLCNPRGYISAKGLPENPRFNAGLVVQVG
ncbi:MAG: metallophosphoesterase [Methylibium sp. NZG]|nr:MAG: metallophosphoesterase [Methylibium sp. NZG]